MKHASVIMVISERLAQSRSIAQLTVLLLLGVLVNLMGLANAILVLGKKKKKRILILYALFLL